MATVTFEFEVDMEEDEVGKDDVVPTPRKLVDFSVAATAVATAMGLPVLVKIDAGDPDDQRDAEDYAHSVGLQNLVEHALGSVLDV